MKHEEDADELVRLIRRVAAGDRRAFHRIHDLEAPRLNSVALRITRCELLAADATQDAFLQVWRHASRFDGGRGNPKAWLASLVRYRAIDIVRRNVHERLMDDVPEQTDNALDALEQLTAKQELAIVRDCISKLGADRHRLLTLVFVEDLTYANLAERLQVPLGTVKSRVRSSLRSLRLCLQEATCDAPAGATANSKCLVKVATLKATSESSDRLGSRAKSNPAN